MPLHSGLKDCLPPDFHDCLVRADASGDISEIKNRLDASIATDPLMKPFAGETGTKYYKPFVQTIVPRVLPAIQQSLKDGSFPEIAVTFEEIDATRQLLGIGSLGSPQDMLYGFTSERYAHWGSTLLEASCFRSACMSGQAKAVVTMAPRYLEIGVPQQEVDELEGAISSDFWETVTFAYDKETRLQPILTDIEAIVGSSFGINAIADPSLADEYTASALLGALDNLIADESKPALGRLKARTVLPAIEHASKIADDAARKRKVRSLLRQKPKPEGVTQEQLGLKYTSEGNFLQKLLGGQRVDHIQSNVKMVPNALRGSKCEVDAIYRVIGRKKLLLVESKEGQKVSRTQLYQVYETFRLRMPSDWEVSSIVILLGKCPDPTVQAQIDVIEVTFDDSLLGKFSESLIAAKVSRHVRWLIRRQ